MESRPLAPFDPKTLPVGSAPVDRKSYAIPVAYTDVIDGKRAYRVLRLTKRQIQFFDVWLSSGDISAACVDAHVSIGQARRWIKLAAHQAYLQERLLQVAISQAIRPEAIKSFWARVMAGVEHADKNRLRASELLATHLHMLDGGNPLFGDGADIDLAIVLRKRVHNGNGEAKAEAGPVRVEPGAAPGPGEG